MGNRQVSGLLSFTVYTRGFAPRHWVCGIIEQQTGVIFSSQQLALLNPLGANSEADVLVSGLSVAPASLSYGWESVLISGVFDGVHQFQAQLNTRREVGEHGWLSASNTWNAAFQGRDGQVHVLSIEFKVTAFTHEWRAETSFWLCPTFSPSCQLLPPSLRLSSVCPLCCVCSLVSW